MGGPCDCDGAAHAEMDNFHECEFAAGGRSWPSAEHYFQAAKFPAGSEAEEEVRLAAGGMDCWKAGHGGRCRADWEEVKVDVMYDANQHKFWQNPHLRRALVATRGEISARGGLFWRTWNSVLLERLREELRGEAERDTAALAARVAMMRAYRDAARRGDARAAEAATRAAAARRLPRRLPARRLTVAGAGDVTEWAAGVFRIDPVYPEANGRPHYVSDGGGHLYFGVQERAGEPAEQAWVLDESFDPQYATGEFTSAKLAAAADVPDGPGAWRRYDVDARRDTAVRLTVRSIAAAPPPRRRPPPSVE